MNKGCEGVEIEGYAVESHVGQDAISVGVGGMRGGGEMGGT